MPPARTRIEHAVRLLLLAPLLLVHRPYDGGRVGAAEPTLAPAAGKSQKRPPTARSASAAPVATESLPPNAAEMRDAILAAARTGDLEELRPVLEWNEIKPDVADHKPEDILTYWRSLSADGRGKAVMDALVALVEGPYAVLAHGSDPENTRVFVWPRAAETAIAAWGADDDAALRRLHAEAPTRLRALGRYQGWRLSIGADGTWHSLRLID